jgi:hypothetical protein
MGLTILDSADSGRIVATVFQFFQPLKYDGKCFLLSDISDNTAHDQSLSADTAVHIFCFWRVAYDCYRHEAGGLLFGKYLMQM